MVWYLNGSADDPRASPASGTSSNISCSRELAAPQGDFSEAVAEIGGQENACTGGDYPAYFQRVAKEHLGLMSPTRPTA